MQYLIFLENFIKTPDGNLLDFKWTMTRKDLNTVVEPFIQLLKMLDQKLETEVTRKGTSFDRKKVWVFRAGGSSKLTAVEDYLGEFYNPVSKDATVKLKNFRTEC